MGYLPGSSVKDTVQFLPKRLTGTEILYNNNTPISTTLWQGGGIQGSTELYSNYLNEYGQYKYLLQQERTRTFHKDSFTTTGFLDDLGRKALEHVGRMDLGSEFLLKRNFYSDSGCSDVPLHRQSGATGSFLWRKYDGYLYPYTDVATPSSTVWPSLSYPDYVEYAQRGTAAIAATIPTNPASDLGQFIGELREGLPILNTRIRNASGFAERASNKYIEYQFAIKPFLSDLKSFASTAKQYNALFENLERNSGKLVRRRFEFPVEKKREILSSGTLRPPVPTIASPLTFSGNYTLERFTTTKYWFSGAYSYYFDRGDLSRNKMLADLEKVDQLYGINPTNPDLLWNLAPWSWLSDWVFNVGDVLSNVRALSHDSLVINWGYIMCHKSIVDVHTISSPANGYYATQSFGTEVKMRRKASPYGFGLVPGGFSTRQKAILAALGISRSAGVVY
jgi:hypothetical protein